MVGIVTLIPCLFFLQISSKWLRKLTFKWEYNKLGEETGLRVLVRVWVCEAESQAGSLTHQSEVYAGEQEKTAEEKRHEAINRLQK